MFSHTAYNDSILKLKLQIEFLNKGVVPLAWRQEVGAPTHFDINKILAEFPPDEARTMRRKFRKLWRNLAAKWLKRPGKNSRRRLTIMGLRDPEPKRRAKNFRKGEVLMAIHRKVSKGPE
jgi:hypothetical protein